MLPCVDGLVERLRTTARCADVGASGADCTIEMARHFPEAQFDAYEVADPALEMAKENVRRRGGEVESRS